MTRLEAIEEILRQTQAGSNSKASYQRLKRACDRLLFTRSEREFIERFLEYRGSDGELYEHFRGV